MNFGPRKIVISIAAIPAIRICPRSTADERDAGERERWLIASASPGRATQLVA